MDVVRKAAVAGTFYPDSPPQLAVDIDRMLAAADVSLAERGLSGLARRPKAFVVPHAGYVYSGETAAFAYAMIRQMEPAPEHVVLLGPAHRVAPLGGMALPGATRLATPLGDVLLDTSLRERVFDLPDHPQSHAQEHSLEVQFPFLKHLLDAPVLPIVVGHASRQSVADHLKKVWGGPETLILISSDLSHFHPYERAQEIDNATVDRICALSAPVFPEQACGAFPLNGFLDVAAERGLEAVLLDQRNSGDTSGRRSEVVGYASIAFFPREAL